MTDILTFFVVILAALLFPLLLRGLHIPWVIALIFAGVVMGPSGLEMIYDDPILEFLSQIGIVFLMFMAGLETGFSRLKKSGKSSLVIAAVNGLVPFALGIIITLYFGYSVLTALVIGTVFISSSVAVILPTLESRELMNSKVGLTVISSTMLQDLSSLILLGALLHYIEPESALPIHFFLLMLFGSIIVLNTLIPKLKEEFNYQTRGLRGKGFETELRLVIVILIGVVAFYELIGLHSIVSGFLAGLFLSDVIKNEELQHKIHAIGYGIFIPIFFIEIGASFDFQHLTGLNSVALMTSAIIIGSVAAKYFSGYLVSRIYDFSHAESSIIGSTSVPQLSTALAAGYIGFQMGLLDQNLLASILALSIVTTVASPFLINRTYDWMDEEKIRSKD